MTPQASSDRPTVTAQLASYIAAAAHTPIPDDVAALTRLHLLDTVAAIVACRDLRAGQVARAFASTAGRGDVQILGTPDRAALVDATFASAVIAHGAEINDFCPSSFVQPGPGVVSTALCVGVARGRTGAEVLRSIAAGYEVACRMPKAIGIESLRRSGMACHSIGSLFGVGTTAGALLHLSDLQAVDLIAYCAQQASGSWQWLLDIEHFEKSFVFGGMAVHNGLHAALLVEAGFSGVPDALDVDGGWLAGGLLAGGDRDGLGALVDGLGADYQIDLVGFKRYPVGGPVQPIVQAMLELMADERDVDIVRIHVSMPGAADTFANARMPALNARYLLALIAIEGGLDFVSAQSLERFRGDDEVRQLMTRITVEHDPTQETVPRSESATVTIDFADGRTRSRHVDHVTGYPTHPMSATEVVDKARTLMAPHFTADRVSHIVDTVLSIADLDSVDPIVDAITRP
ncbi:MmgE/PrpD family protein [Desertimonas flava]|uniref:MmgE/PrpD family protein n=1 Tax=Desertimonas flava TaxID=2064846 RepID=UPI000E34886D|nr:MmgE/PrpD family protein [Desertimonas flava]